MSSAGQNYLSFTDFVRGTGLVIHQPGKTRLLNEATKESYAAKRFYKGKNDAQVFQGGTEIRWDAMFDERSTFEPSAPGKDFHPSNPQVDENFRQQWVEYRDHIMWYDNEPGLNEGGDLSSPERQFQTYYNVLEAKQMRMWTSVTRGQDDLLFVRPDASTMEGSIAAPPTEQMSVLALVNEYPDGLAYKGNSGSDVPAGGIWTTVHGGDPTAAKYRGRWKPYQDTYAQVPPASGDTHWDLLDALERAYHRTQRDTLPMHPEYSEDMYTTDFIATSLTGLTNYHRGIRMLNESHVYTKQDPRFRGLIYGGIPIIRVQQLEEVAFYPNGGSGLATELAGAKQGPRYYGFQTKYMHPVHHERLSLRESEVITDLATPDMHTKVYWFRQNFICASRQRQFVISPSATLS